MTYVFIDASNLFYGGKNRLNWRIDYKKLISYLRYRYEAKQIFYYSGVETHGFKVDISSTEEYPIKALLKHLRKLEKEKTVRKDLIKKDISKAKFLLKLQTFGYILRLKPVKHIGNVDGSFKVKANCDVDLTLDVVRLREEFNRVLLFSGDGDFEILLRYLKEIGCELNVFGKSENTAFTIKKNFAMEYVEFGRLRDVIEQK
jgi:uncharacterized LabA/DUF88 family protein